MVILKHCREYFSFTANFLLLQLIFLVYSLKWGCKQLEQKSFCSTSVVNRNPLPKKLIPPVLRRNVPETRPADLRPGVVDYGISPPPLDSDLQIPKKKDVNQEVLKASCHEVLPIKIILNQ